MRFYEKALPDPDDVVMVQVRQIAEMGAYVNLLEYDNAEGMIMLSELSRRRIRSIQKLIRVGRNEVVVVMRVDKDKGYIDLSKRRVDPEDIEKCAERYQKSKTVHNLMSQVAGKTNYPLEQLYKKVCWPLDKKFGHCFDAFKLSIVERGQVFDGLEPLPPEVDEQLRLNIVRKLTPQPVKLRADVEVTCFSPEGIDAIKKALQAGMSASTEEFPIQVKLVAPPLYVVLCSTTNKNGGLEVLEKALEKIQDSIIGSRGTMAVKMAPKAVSETEDKELEQLMARAEKENAEVDGDSDSESD